MRRAAGAVAILNFLTLDTGMYAGVQGLDVQDPAYWANQLNQPEAN